MRPIFSVSVENFLSFQKAEVKLGPLNVLVGPNGAGKSNFLKVFQFLQTVADDDFGRALSRFGYVSGLVFRGDDGRSSHSRQTRIAIRASLVPKTTVRHPDRYTLGFSTTRPGESTMASFLIESYTYNRVETMDFTGGCGDIERIEIQDTKCSIHYVKSDSTPRAISMQNNSTGLHTLPKLGDEFGGSQVDRFASIFANHRFLDIDVDAIRRPSHGHAAANLEPNASNLVYFLAWLKDEHPIQFEKLSEDIAYILPGLRGMAFFSRDMSDDAITLELAERHLAGTTPLAQASYGTIRAIALLAALHDPNPPRLTCIEEIDQGFHPHALDRIVDRLREASKRTQFVVTTHSPAFVNRLQPSELIILERDPATGGTRPVDIPHRKMSEMEEVSGYRMGELWFSGILGGGLGQDA